MDEAVHSISVGERVLTLHTQAAERVLRSLAFAWKLANWSQAELLWAIALWRDAKPILDTSADDRNRGIRRLSWLVRRWDQRSMHKCLMAMWHGFIAMQTAQIEEEVP